MYYSFCCNVNFTLHNNQAYLLKILFIICFSSVAVAVLFLKGKKLTIICCMKLFTLIIELLLK